MAACLLASACHESDSLGGTLALRVDVGGFVAPPDGDMRAGDVLDLTVALADGRGRTFGRERRVALRLIGSGGRGASGVSPASVVVPADSIVPVSVQLRAAGRFRLMLTAADAAPWLSPPLRVAPGEPAALRFETGPTATPSGVAQTVAVAVVDAFGNPADFAGGVTLDGQAVGLPRTVAAADGVAVFDDVTMLDGGDVGLTAAAGGLPVEASPGVQVGGDIVHGTATYARVPQRFDLLFGVTLLDYPALRDEPIAGALVRLVAGAGDGAVVAEATTDERGRFALPWPAGGREGEAVVVRVLAQTVKPALRVIDNTAGNVLYVLDSAPLTKAQALGGNVALHADSGWDGFSYSAERAAAPFAVLDSIRRAAHALVPDWVDALPPLAVGWSEDNRREGSGGVANGAIGTSHYDGKRATLYLLGEADVDTDEYDVPVVVHEWGHFLFERGLERSDGVGGLHGLGLAMDARTAFEEGVCNTLAAVAGLTDVPVYGDSVGLGQGVGWVERLEDNIIADPTPGWQSETTAQALFYDLVDGVAATEPVDQADFGWAGARALLEAVAAGPRYATVYTLLEAADAVPGGFVDGEGSRKLAELHGLEPPGNGGWDENLPLYREVGSDGAVLALTLEGPPADVDVGDWSARASANRYVAFVGDGRSWAVTVDAGPDVDLYLAQDGVALLEARGTTGFETIIVTTQPGATYLVNVRGWSEDAGTYVAMLDVRPQRRAGGKKRPPAWATWARWSLERGPPALSPRRTAKQVQRGQRRLRAVRR